MPNSILLSVVWGEYFRTGNKGSDDSYQFFRDLIERTILEEWFQKFYIGWDIGESVTKYASYSSISYGPVQEKNVHEIGFSEFLKPMKEKNAFSSVMIPGVS